MANLPTYVLERVFDAPRELVWKTWTDPKLVPRWYGPGVKSIVHRHELKPGGLWLHEMQWSSNSKYERIEFTEVTQPQRLVWLQSAADADWNVASSPMMPNWPRVLLTTVTFEEAGSQTKLRLTWVPHQATPAEIACFASAMAGVDKGWGAGMKLFAELLAELQS